MSCWEGSAVTTTGHSTQSTARSTQARYASICKQQPPVRAVTGGRCACDTPGAEPMYCMRRNFSVYICIGYSHTRPTLFVSR